MSRRAQYILLRGRRILSAIYQGASSGRFIHAGAMVCEMVAAFQNHMHNLRSVRSIVSRVVTYLVPLERAGVVIIEQGEL